MKTFSGRNPSQRADELLPFIELLRGAGVRRYGEIGARHGDTFHAVLKALRCSGVALDLPGGLWGSSKTPAFLERAVRNLKGLGLDASCLFGDSTTAATRNLFAGRGPYDAILIDGDHTLAGVTADWEFCRGLAPVVAFHDIVGTGQAEKVYGNGVEVPILWSSIKKGWRTLEFVGQGSAMGIGVVYTQERL